MLVACVGDVMLDVIVDAPGGLVADDDTPAHISFTAGGQAANVAGWVCEGGGRARVFGPRAAVGPGRYVDEALAAAGIEVHGPTTPRAGTVVSVLTDGTRSLASDPGSTAWLDQVAPGPWLEDVDWLFVSGYALFRSATPHRIVETAAAARASGARVAVDLSSAAMIRAYGATRFHELWQALRPTVVLANEREWEATHTAGAVPVPDPGDAPGVSAGPAPSDGVTPGVGVLVLKQGARGCSFVIDGVTDHRDPEPGPVIDATGAGDALTAGFLLGGADLAMTTAARCVARVGAQPSSLVSGITWRTG